MFLEVPITLSRQLVSLCLQARKAISWLIGPPQDKEVYTLKNRTISFLSLCCSSLQAPNAVNPRPLCSNHTIPTAARLLHLDGLADTSNSFLESDIQHLPPKLAVLSGSHHLPLYCIWNLLQSWPPSILMSKLYASGFLNTLTAFSPT